MKAGNNELKWIVAAKRSFLILKKVIEKPVLALLDLNKVFHVDYDANGTAIGGVLCQGGRPIGYFSEKLSEAKQNYSTYDQDFYALV